VSEAGLTNTLWGQNPGSLLSAKAVVGAGHKEHTLQADPLTWESASMERVLQERRAGPFGATGAAMQKLASNSKVRTLRDIGATIVSGALGLGDELVDSSIDLDQLEQIRHYAAAEGGRSGVADKLQAEDYAQLRAAALAAYEAAGTTPSIRSGNLCLHLEPAEDGSLGLTKTRLELPLRKNLVALRGQTSFSPMRTFGIMVGTLVADVVGGELVLYVTFSSQSYFPSDFKDAGVSLQLPSGFYLGPADGKPTASTSYPLAAPDGRSTEHITGPSTLRNRLTIAVATVPIDYLRFYQPWEQACPPERVDKLQAAWKNISMAAEAASWDKVSNVMYALAEVGYMVLNVDCGSNFLNATPQATHGYDGTEVAVWGHFVVEMMFKDIIEYTTHAFWNDGIISGPRCDDVVNTQCENSYSSIVETALTQDFLTGTPSPPPPPPVPAATCTFVFSINSLDCTGPRGADPNGHGVCSAFPDNDDTSCKQQGYKDSDTGFISMPCDSKPDCFEHSDKEPNCIDSVYDMLGARFKYNAGPGCAGCDGIKTVTMSVDPPGENLTTRFFTDSKFRGCYCDVALDAGSPSMLTKRFRGDAEQMESLIWWSGDEVEESAINPNGKRPCEKCDFYTDPPEKCPNSPCNSTSGNDDDNPLCVSPAPDGIYPP